MLVSTNSKCPYFGGINQKGRRYLVKCGDNHLLSYDTKEKANFKASTECENKQPNNCRAFLFRQLEEMGVGPTSEWSTDDLRKEYFKRQCNVKSEVTTMNVPIGWIEPNPRNPRKNFDPVSLQELADSIKSVGIVQPLIVVHIQEKFEQARKEDRLFLRLIAGERRWRAAQLAGLEKVPVIIKDLTPEQEAEVMIIENLQRKDLDPIDEARGMQAMIKEYGWTQEQLAEKLGCSQGHIANRLRMLELPEEVLEKISQEIITPAHAKHLVKLVGLPGEALKEVLQEIEEEDMTERQLAEYIDDYADDNYNRLFSTDDYTYRNPVFDTAGCSKCQNMLKAHWGGQLRKFCTDEECWDKKQDEARKAKNAQEAQDKKQETMATDGILDLGKLGYSNWSSFNQNGGSPAFDYSVCEKCENKRKGRWGNGKTEDVCTNPECYRKKAAVATRERNKAIKEAYKKEVQLVEETFEARAQQMPMFDKTDLIFIAMNMLWHVQKNYSQVFERPHAGKYLEDRFGIKGIQATYYNFGGDNFKKIKDSLEKLTVEQLQRIIMEWPILARGTDEKLTKWYLDHCVNSW